MGRRLSTFWRDLSIVVLGNAPTSSRAGPAQVAQRRYHPATAAARQTEHTLISERVKDTKRNLRRQGKHQGGAGGRNRLIPESGLNPRKDRARNRNIDYICGAEKARPAAVSPAGEPLTTRLM